MVSRSHVISKLLNKNENDEIISRLGSNVTANSIAVARLFQTESEESTVWNFIGSGSVVFVRDANRRSYYIRFFSFDELKIDFEQELYKNMELVDHNNQFLTFECDTFMTGLQFTSPEEFESFKSLIAAKLSKPASTSKKQNSGTSKQIKKRESTKAKKKDNSESKTKKTKSKKNQKPKLEIGAPENFQVIAHVGQDGVSGLENIQDSHKWKQLVQFIYGGSTEISKEEETHLVDLVNNNGGIERFACAVEKKQKTTSTPKTLSPAPPPPPPAPPSGGLPPPPPPPCGGPPPPPPPAPSSSANNTASSVSLLDQIQKGKQLKKVETNDEEDEEEAEGLLGALVNNLATFRKNMTGDTDDSDAEDDEESDEDEWDD